MELRWRLSAWPFWRREEIILVQWRGSWGQYHIEESVHGGSEEAKGTDRKWDELHVRVVELADDFITRKGDASLFACDSAVATFPR